MARVFENPALRLPHRQLRRPWFRIDRGIIHRELIQYGFRISARETLDETHPIAGAGKVCGLAAGRRYLPWELGLVD